MLPSRAGRGTETFTGSSPPLPQAISVSPDIMSIQRHAKLTERKRLRPHKMNGGEMRQTVVIDRSVLEVRIAIEPDLTPHHCGGDRRMGAVCMDNRIARDIVQQHFRLRI